MGQRLNLEILKGNKVLANSYYHWSGYTSSALELTKCVLDNLKNISYEDSVLKAIKLLEVTGAGLTDDEKQYASELYKDVQFGECSGRNEGLIAISENGINETREWEEARVQIHIDTEQIDFGAYICYSKEEYREDYEEDPEKIPEYTIHFMGKAIPFNAFDSFNKTLQKLRENKIYCFRVAGDEENVYMLIE